LLLESQQSRFLSPTLLLVCALGNPPSRMLLIQTHDALEQALLVGSEFPQPCNRERLQRPLQAAVMPSFIEWGHNPQAHKADHEPIRCDLQDRSRSRAA
jgi:hypothetical protein